MSELTVAEEYRNLVNQAPGPVVSGIDSATQKAAELGFLHVLFVLETSVASTILRSENLTTALTKIALFNQITTLKLEAFQQGFFSAIFLKNNRIISDWVTSFVNHPYKQKLVLLTSLRKTRQI